MKAFEIRDGEHLVGILILESLRALDFVAEPQTEHGIVLKLPPNLRLIEQPK